MTGILFSASIIQHPSFIIPNMLLACMLALSAQAPHFTNTWDSLKQFKAPEWYRDAKFGIWAHWGPQSVPMEGDWYARQMYQQGTGDYDDHLKWAGHPSKFGYKDLIPLWKAEKWDPEKLMKLYKKAGARYFVSMGVHHDNFDLWDSKFNKWNAKNMGPHRDMVGEWQKAAHHSGLKFGVSEHLGASYNWFQVAHGADKTGPMAGVPYDGADPRYEDLYHTKGDPTDTGWYTKNPEWHKTWFDRISDLVDHYHPDILYSDGGIPFGEVGRQLVANFYNQSPGKVYLCKDGSPTDFQLGTCVLDRERGEMAATQALPWQTDTSIADWFYNKHWKYRSPDWVIDTLVDVVSKNGNMLLNVVQRPDGSLDDEVLQLLDSMSTWFATNGEAIYGTRPWLTYGEGPTKVAGGHFHEDFPFGAKDIRFTTKGKHTLYATFLGWPEGIVSIRSLGQMPGVTAKIQNIQLLGSKEKLTWQNGPEGLAVKMPATKSGDLAHVLKITCSDVNGFRPDLVPVPPREAIAIGANHDFLLQEEMADISGAIQVEHKGGGTNFGFWDNGADSVTWTISVTNNGYFGTSLEAATTFPGTDLLIEVLKESDHTLVSKSTRHVDGTGSWDTFKPYVFDNVTLEPGRYEVKVTAADPTKWSAVNIRSVRLTPRILR